MMGLFLSISVDAKSKKKKSIKTENDSAVKNIIMVSPLSMVGGSIMGGFEHLFDEKKSLRINVAFGTSERSNYYRANSYNDTVQRVVSGSDLRNTTQLYVELQYKFRIYQKEGDDFSVYMAPLALYKSMEYTVDLNQIVGTIETEKKQSASAFGVGYIIGVQLLKTKGLYLDTYFGGGMMSPSGDYQNISTATFMDRYKKGTFGHMGLSIGIAL